MKSWPKVKLGNIIMLPLFGFIYSYFDPIYHFGPDLIICIYISKYLALCTFIYPHLALLTLIWLYLPLIALIWQYMPYSPYIDILLARLHLCAKF